MYKSLLSLIVVFAFLSCKKDNLNQGFNNHDNNLTVIKTDTFTVVTSQLGSDTIITSNRTEVFLGAYHSSETGLIQSNLYFSLTPVTSSFASGLDTKYDSLILEFKINERYGTEPLELELFLTTETVLSSKSYNNLDSLVTGNKITEFTIGLDTLIQIKIPLDFGENWFNSRSIIYANSTNFLAQNPGFVLKPKNNNTLNNTGAMYTISVSSIRTILHYSNLTTNFLALATVSNPSWSFYQIKNNFSGSTIQNNLNNQNLANNNVIIQGLGSSKAQISFPYLIDWYSKSNKIINRAEIIAKTNLPFEANFTPLNSLSIYKQYNTSTSGFESVLNNSNNSYTFNATSIIRDYLTNKDFTIVLGALNPHARSGYSNLIGGNNNTPIQLVLYYTEF
jgi:hypothetical protein